MMDSPEQKLFLLMVTVDVKYSFSNMEYNDVRV